VAVDTTTQTVAPPVTGEEVRNPLDEDDQPRARWERSIGWGIVVIATILAWNVLDANHNWGHFEWIGPIPWWSFHGFKFGDLFLNTTANGGDMGAHVWWPWFLEHNWFPKGRLAGWAPDWYAGFPAGQYYFPLPSLSVAALDLILPYNVAFKLVTVAGPLMLPSAAYYFAKGMKAPWPAPPAFAIAAIGMLMETRTDWQIYGGNIASTLAGEFSFTIGLAFALFGLGALAQTLDSGKRRWLPAVLIAAAVMSHIVVAIFIALAATLLWLTRRPLRTFPIAAAVGGVAIMIPGIWLVPLLTNQGYTQSMRYTKLVPKQGFTMWSWLPLPGFVKNTVNGVVRGFDSHYDVATKKTIMQPLWLPWWILLLAAVAIVAAGWYRRRSTLVLLVLAVVLAIMFVQWPEHAIWNTRFLPFYLFTCGLLAAMGATEIVRWMAMAVAWAYRWIREGDLQDARARAWAELATSDENDPDIDPELRKQAAWALAERKFDTSPEGWTPPERVSPAAIRQRSKFVGSVALAIITALTGVFALNRAWDARNGNPAIAITGWASWNYSGYEKKAAYPQYKAVIDGMEQVADTPGQGPGRALWEPSSGDPDAINSYGTSLALELLPYFTKGKIGSMEGIYFESSATTSYHFLTVAECSQNPSNPVRGLVYGHVATDFDLCVKHLQDLGVRYLMLWTKEANAQAEKQKDLTLIKTIPQNPPIAGPQNEQLSDWKVYQVADSDLVQGLDTMPVVASPLHGGSYSQCWNQPWPDPSSPEPRLEGWECTAAPWWNNKDQQDIVWAQAGPKEWQRVDGKKLGDVTPQKIDNPAQVSNVKRSVDKISFDVDQIGKPVVVKESFYPNWKVSGAQGPYRLAPNLMVVVPTKNHVTLTYGLTFSDWLGRIVTVLGIIGLVLLALWVGATRYAAGAATRQGDPETGDDDNGHEAIVESGDDNGADPDDGAGGGGPDDPDLPPDVKEPEPALP
jgi:hypothetical protein